MARLNAAEKEAALKEEQRQREKERKERAPSVAGSLKEGVKSALRLAAGGGEADKARKTLAKRTQETDEAMKKIDD